MDNVSHVLSHSLLGELSVSCVTLPGEDRGAGAWFPQTSPHKTVPFAAAKPDLEPGSTSHFIHQPHPGKMEEGHVGEDREGENRAFKNPVTHGPIRGHIQVNDSEDNLKWVMSYHRNG